MRTANAIFVLISAIFLHACATSGAEAPPAATFRRVDVIEYYDFRLRVSHAGADMERRVRDCSTEAFYCYSGVTTLIAPRRCALSWDLLRSGDVWRVSGEYGARFLFRSEDQLYYESYAADREPGQAGVSGFVYDVERGLIGVWRTPSALQQRPTFQEQARVIASTKWLEAPRSLFACGG